MYQEYWNVERDISSLLSKNDVFIWCSCFRQLLTNFGGKWYKLKLQNVTKNITMSFVISSISWGQWFPVYISIHHHSWYIRTPLSTFSFNSYYLPIMWALFLPQTSKKIVTLRRNFLYRQQSCQKPVQKVYYAIHEVRVSPANKQ